MKGLIALSLLTFGRLGCSSVKPLEVLTDKKSPWPVGQHDLCLFKDKLVCIGQPTTDQDKAAINIMARSVHILNALTEEEGLAEKGVYDVKLSASPAPYSVWNCVKTGNVSPAVECVLVKAPDEKQKAAIAQQEKDQEEGRAASQTLYSLGEKQVEQQCGAPLQKASDRISVMTAYKGSSKFVGFKFDTLSHSVHSYEPEGFLDYAGLNSNPPANLNFDFVLGDSGKHWSHAGGPNKSYKFDDARVILKELPCLKK